MPEIVKRIISRLELEFPWHSFRAVAAMPDWTLSTDTSISKPFFVEVENADPDKHYPCYKIFVDNKNVGIQFTRELLDDFRWQSPMNDDEIKLKIEELFVEAFASKLTPESWLQKALL